MCKIRPQLYCVCVCVCVCVSAVFKIPELLGLPWWLSGKEFACQ